MVAKYANENIEWVATTWIRQAVSMWNVATCINPITMGTQICIWMLSMRTTELVLDGQTVYLWAYRIGDILHKKAIPDFVTVHSINNLCALAVLSCWADFNHMRVQTLIWEKFDKILCNIESVYITILHLWPPGYQCGPWGGI